MKLKAKKKGFTIVELVVVIAVIAVLAAVLIPTFSNVIKKAQISSDTQLVRNMNTALSADEAYTNEKPEDMTKVITVLHEAGYVVGNLNPTTEGYYYVWDSEKNQIVFINDQLTAHFPADADMSNKARYWATASTAAEAQKLGNAGYSVYLEKDVTDPISIMNWVSFDTGIMKASSVSISGTGSSTIKTYGQIASLTVDNGAGSVDNYGSIGELTAKVADNCFNNYGSIADVKAITTGKLVNKAIIMNVSSGVAAANVDNTAGIIVASSVAEIPASGTNANAVIEVKTASALQNLAYAVNDGADFSKVTIKLMNDIDLSGRTWIPFGSVASSSFAGTIDGNNHKISGLSNDGYVGGASYQGSTSINEPYGLISAAWGTVEIKNLALNVNIDFDGEKESVAGFIGTYNKKNYQDTVTFTKCRIEGNINAKKKVGGFIGTTYNDFRGAGTWLVDSYSTANRISFTDCTSVATIVADSRAGGYVGAINCYLTEFTNCDFSGSVTVTSATPGATNNWAVSGYIGYETCDPQQYNPNGETFTGSYAPSIKNGNQSSVKIIFTNCTSTGTVSGNADTGYSKKYVGSSDKFAIIKGIEDTIHKTNTSLTEIVS